MRDLAFMRRDQRERPRLEVPADFVPFKSKPAWAEPDPDPSEALRVALQEGIMPLPNVPVEALETRPTATDDELRDELEVAQRAGACVRVALLRSELRRRKRERGEPCDCIGRPEGGRWHRVVALWNRYDLDEGTWCDHVYVPEGGDVHDATCEAMGASGRADPESVYVVDHYPVADPAAG